MHKLTDKEERFVDEYMKDFNGAQAAVRAGYGKKRARQTAYRLRTKGHIQRAIEKRKAELHDENKDEVSRIRESLAEIAYSRDDPDNPTSDYKYSAQTRLRALELLGKAESMFSEKIIHTPEIPRLTPEQVKKYRERAALLDGTHPGLTALSLKAVDSSVVAEKLKP